MLFPLAELLVELHRGNSMIIDMFLKNYSQPQPLRRMMEDVLTGEVLREFATLQELVTHGPPVASSQALDVSAPPPRSEERTDAQLLIELATNPDRQAAVKRVCELKWEALRREVNESVKEEACSAYDLSFYGWPEGRESREPELLNREVLCEGEFLLPANEIRSRHGVRYISCIVVLKKSVSGDEGTLSVNGKPLFFFHEKPRTGWYQKPPSLEGDDVPVTDVTTLSNRDLRKQKTQERHGRWCDAYDEIKAQHPEKSDVWISERIAKLPIADGASAETIRRNMKRK